MDSKTRIKKTCKPNNFTTRRRSNKSHSETQKKRSSFIA